MNRPGDTPLTPEKHRPIFLIGFMGSGKSTVGRALAEYLGYDFRDLDELIEQRAGRSVKAIFNDLGEDEFRRLEHQAVRDLKDCCRVVIALGGGAYVSEENRKLIRAIGKTVWLDCPLEVCLRRVSGDLSRPLLGDESKMSELLDARRGAYAQADIVVKTGELSPGLLAKKIAAEISEF
jgi:shikimate kinase